jgi:ubiquinone/menaquinone biosynthesis C-methylase UbiE
MNEIEKVESSENSEARAVQQRFYGEECDPEFEIIRPHSCGRLYEYLIEHKFQTGLRLIGTEIAGRSVLEVCCGSGMMSQKFARRGARVTGIDFSSAAIARARERARRFDFNAHFLVGDAENLAFQDRSYDIVAVHDGLHHLGDPFRAIGEMARVARNAVLVMDPADAAFTRLAVRLRLAVDVEDAGNEVKRLVPSEVAAYLRSRGFELVRWRRTLMYYPHVPNGWFRALSTAWAFWAVRATFHGANIVAGRWGNKLAVGALRCRSS